MKSSFVALIAFLSPMLMIFTSCGTGDLTGDGKSTDSDSGSLPADENTTAPETPKVYVSDYAVVRSMKASGIVKQATAELCNSLNASYGGYAGVTDDWLDKGVDPDKGEIHEKREILIGETNRGESRVSGLSLEPSEYVIFNAEAKIVLLGGSDKALYTACKVFITLLKQDSEGKFTVEIPGGYLKGKDDKIKPYLILAADQKMSQVAVYDVSVSTDISSANALKVFSFSEYNIADTRLREYEGKTVLLAAYGFSSARIIDYETGDDIFSTNQTAQNPHAAEIMPCGVLAVAASTGAQVRFFNIKSGNSEMTAIDFPDSHGLLYDPQNDVLWAIGKNQLKAYTVSLGNDGAPVATEVPELAATIPTSGAHDLQPVYGDTDRLWISTSSAVYQYSKSQKKFFTDYAGNSDINKKSIKAVGNFDDGSVLTISPDKAFRDWTSASATLYIRFGDTFGAVKLKSTDGGFYKVRVANKNYQ